MQVTLLLSSPACSHNWCCNAPSFTLCREWKWQGCVCEVWALSLVLLKTPCSLTLGNRDGAHPGGAHPRGALCECCVSSHPTVGGHKEPDPKSTQRGTRPKPGQHTNQAQVTPNYAATNQSPSRLSHNTEVRFQSLCIQCRGAARSSLNSAHFTELSLGSMA